MYVIYVCAYVCMYTCTTPTPTIKCQDPPATAIKHSIHTHTYTYIHTLHTYTNTNTYTPYTTNSDAYILEYTCMHTYIHTYAHIRVQQQARVLPDQSSTRTRCQSHMHTYKYTHTNMHTPGSACQDEYASISNACTHTHTQI
jgi:hypothetical protein